MIRKSKKKHDQLKYLIQRKKKTNYKTKIMIHRDIINELIKIGEDESIISNTIEKMNPQGQIIGLSSREWYQISKLLSSTEIISLFKGVVIVEKDLQWTGGSVSAGIWIYRVIKNRKLDEDYSIANWALKITDNEYIPFGSSNYCKKNVVDYFLKKQEFSYKKEIDKLNKEKNHIELGLNNRIKQLENKTIELQLKIELSDLTPNELAQHIIADQEHPVYYYFKEIEKLIQSNDVSKDNLELIYGKFKEKEKKNIKELKARLREKILQIVDIRTNQLKESDNLRNIKTDKKYLSQAHKEVSEKKMKQVQEWMKSPLSPQEMQRRADIHFKAHNRLNPKDEKEINK
jgi:hypothetical protein